MFARIDPWRFAVSLTDEGADLDPPAPFDGARPEFHNPSAAARATYAREASQGDLESLVQSYWCWLSEVENDTWAESVPTDLSDWAQEIVSRGVGSIAAHATALTPVVTERLIDLHVGSALLCNSACPPHVRDDVLARALDAGFWSRTSDFPRFRPGFTPADAAACAAQAVVAAGVVSGEVLLKAGWDDLLAGRPRGVGLAAAAMADPSLPGARIDETLAGYLQVAIGRPVNRLAMGAPWRSDNVSGGASDQGRIACELAAAVARQPHASEWALDAAVAIGELFSLRPILGPLLAALGAIPAVRRPGRLAGFCADVLRRNSSREAQEVAAALYLRLAPSAEVFRGLVTRLMTQLSPGRHPDQPIGLHALLTGAEPRHLAILRPEDLASLLATGRADDWRVGTAALAHASAGRSGPEGRAEPGGDATRESSMVGALAGNQTPKPM